MKIAFDIRKINDFGIGNYIANLLTEISRLDLKNEYYLLGYKRDFEGLKGKFPENFNFVSATAGKYSMSEQLKLPLILEKIKPDVFHSPHYVIPILYKGKIITTIHDIIHILFPEFLPNPLAFYYAKYFIGAACKKSRLIITVSENSKKDILRHFPEARDKISVIYNGIDNRFFKDLQIQVREKEGLYILYTGNIKKHKNLETLIKAYSKLEKSFPHKLMIVGGNPYRELVKIVDELNLNEKVIFKGYVSESELISLYEQASLFIFPSLYEGFGIPPLEAMAMGIPVLSSNFSSLPEILKDGAIYFNPLDENELFEKAKELLSNEMQKEKLIKKGKEIAKEYSWKNNALKTLKLYEIIGKNE
ncbi:MAG: glycosyltransferase family 1 protein [Acidobacteriota bacterium]